MNSKRINTLVVMLTLVTGTLFAAAPVADLPMTTDTVVDGIAQDVSGNGHDATLNGQELVEYDWGEALLFNGTGVALLADPNKTLPINDTDSTLMFWYVADTDTDTPNPIISHAMADGAHLPQGRVIGLNAIHPNRGWSKPGQLMIDHANVGNIESDPNTNLSDGEWHHVAYTQAYSMITDPNGDPNAHYEDIVLYINGEVDAEKQWAMTYQSWQLGGTPEDYIVSLGANTQQILWSGNKFRGELDDVKFYGETLKNRNEIMVAADLAENIWSEDFEGTAAGTTSGSNQSMEGTVIQTANGLSGVVVDLDDPNNAELAAAFTSGSGNVLCLNGTNNAWAAVRTNINPINFDAISVDTPIACSFDLYIPEELPNAIGKLNPRLKGPGSSGNGSTDDSLAVTSAGVHHIDYRGTISDFSNAPENVDNARPFLFLAPQIEDEGFAYIDNIILILGGL